MAQPPIPANITDNDLIAGIGGCATRSHAMANSQTIHSAAIAHRQGWRGGMGKCVPHQYHDRASDERRVDNRFNSSTDEIQAAGEAVAERNFFDDGLLRFE